MNEGQLREIREGKNIERIGSRFVCRQKDIIKEKTVKIKKGTDLDTVGVKKIHCDSGGFELEKASDLFFDEKGDIWYLKRNNNKDKSETEEDRINREREYAAFLEVVSKIKPSNEVEDKKGIPSLAKLFKKIEKEEKRVKRKFNIEIHDNVVLSDDGIKSVWEVVSFDYKNGIAFVEREEDDNRVYKGSVELAGLSKYKLEPKINKE